MAVDDRAWVPMSHVPLCRRMVHLKVRAPAAPLVRVAHRPVTRRSAMREDDVAVEVSRAPDPAIWVTRVAPFGSLPVVTHRPAPHEVRTARRGMAEEGVPRGVTAADGAEAADVPAAFVAVAVKV